MVKMFSKKRVWLSGFCIVIGGVVIDFVVFPVTSRFLSTVPRNDEAVLLVVQGWIFDSMIEQVAADFNRGNYHSIIVSGSSMMTHVTKKRLVVQGIDSSIIFLAPYSKKTEKDYTFNEALYVRKLLDTQFPAVTSINVATGSMHSKKSVTVFRKVLGNKFNVGIVACKPNHYDYDHIWKSRHGMYNTVRFFIGYLYALVWRVEWIKG